MPEGFDQLLSKPLQSRNFREIIEKVNSAEMTVSKKSLEQKKILISEETEEEMKEWRSSFIIRFIVWDVIIYYLLFNS